jgi:hypothetical protein
MLTVAGEEYGNNENVEGADGRNGQIRARRKQKMKQRGRTTITAVR